MSKHTIRKSPIISRESTNQDTSFFPDNPYCLHHRLQKGTPTVLIAGTITNRLSIKSASGVPRFAEASSEAHRAAESTIRLIAYCGVGRCTTRLGALERVGENNRFGEQPRGTVHSWYLCQYADGRVRDRLPDLALARSGTHRTNKLLPHHLPL